MKRFHLSLLAILLTVSCATAPLTRPNDREWSAIDLEHQRLQAERGVFAPASATASRKEQLEVRLATLRRTEAAQNAFLEKLREYYERTADPRGARLYAAEKVRLANDYADLLSRYDRAIELYQAALVIDPGSVEALQNLERARAKRYIPLAKFSTVAKGMTEEQVRLALGRPREDWIKQLVQKGKIYSVWIYPKEDGGACAIYFDNGVVYFVNWNAAAAREQSS